MSGRPPDVCGTLHAKLDLDNPTERAVGQMIRILPRNHLKLWLLRVIRHRLGTDNPAAMAERLRDDLLGNLEDGHKRSQTPPAKKDRLERPPTSEPLGKPPAAEPLGRRPKKDEDPLKKARPRAAADGDSLFV